MTDETKKLFDAPWTVKHHVHACWEVDFEISTADRMSVAVSPTEEHTNSLAHLPELYDALVEEATEKCNECLHDNLRMGRIPFTGKYDLVEAGCPFKDEQCHTASHLDLLKKVRAGK